MAEIVDIRQAVAELSTPERAELAAYLIDTLDSGHHWVEDAEVVRRSEELDSGAVKPITREEFNRACGH